MNTTQRNRNKTQFIARFGVLLAIEAIFSFTPLGSLPVGPVVATLGMLPVVVAAITMGTAAGSLMGFFGGLFSFIVFTFMQPGLPTAFLFTPFHAVAGVGQNPASLLICFVPRVLTGTVAGALHAALKKAAPTRALLHSGLACLAGSFTNTVLVMGGAALFFAPQMGPTMEAVLLVIGGIILTNGVPEAILAGAVGFCVGRIRRRPPAPSV